MPEKKVCIVRNRCNKIRGDAHELTPGDKDYGRWLQEILGRYHSCDDWGVTIHKMLISGVAECGGTGRQVLKEVSNDL